MDEVSVETLAGVGQNVASLLRRLNISSVEDLLQHYPRRYEDYSKITPVKSLEPGMVTLKAKISQASGRYIRRGLHITEAIASDSTGSVRLVWFNQPFRVRSIKHGEEYYLTGSFELRRQRLSLQNPAIELVSSFPLHGARIVPIYKETKGLGTKQLRRLIATALPLLDQVDDSLPIQIVVNSKLLKRNEAIKQLHFPVSMQQVKQAERRLGFEEIFELSLASLLNKAEVRSEHSLKIKFTLDIAKQFVAQLPFQLTDSQRRVIWQIYQDMEHGEPMNRLLEGDVGSGKTVVAAMAALMVINDGYQIAYMAPTELLAKQQVEAIRQLFIPMGYGDQVGLLVGSMSSKQKQEITKLSASGEIKCIVGTHALIQESFAVKKLGLIIIDEQHRFGVEQRRKLQSKSGHMPHVLTMTATPIPRSLALTLYGEMDISVIENMPSGRKSTQTKVFSSEARPQMLREVVQLLSMKQQCFWVCPLIKMADDEGGMNKPTAAEEVYIRLKDHELKSYRIGLLHGKMKAAEKDQVMAEFKAGDIDVLVATTVVEVGVHVPNATVMVVEDADRFGLAQIHQLRGRVGRGEHPGHCFLVSSKDYASQRLSALETSNDGFKLAELDLQLRGPGALYGASQHGLLDLRMAKLSDGRLISEARSAAKQFLDEKPDLLQYKHLAKRVSRLRSVTNIN